MAGENEENIASAMNSSATPPAGLTRREIREWERQHENKNMSSEDQLAVEMERQLTHIQSAAPAVVVEEPLPVAAESVTPEPQAPVFLSRRELRAAETAEIQIISEPVVAPTESAPVLFREAEAVVPEPVAGVPEAEIVASVEAQAPALGEIPFELTEEEEPVQTVAEVSVPIAQLASSRIRPHILLRRAAKKAPSLTTIKSKLDLTDRARRRRISQMIFSAGALIVCFAFALSVSIPANALLTQSDVEHIKMQAFLDEQVALASQSVSISSESGGTNLASRDGVDVTLAAKSVAVTSYGSSGLCGPETEANPPSSSGSIQWPLASVKLSSPYGPRWGTLHAGTDFDPGYGASILAAADGIVIAAYPSAGNSLGICAIISHNVNGVKFDTLYGHMSQMDVSVGQSVSAGQLVGLVGSTGNSTGPHLHFEVHVNGIQIDPEPFMRIYAGAPPA